MLRIVFSELNFKIGSKPTSVLGESDGISIISKELLSACKK
jgi:hypothetical protein